ncbi:hypothetical protein CEXT_189081 [Caerostris extrusa]|uniref:FHA domain-containing protein n=1 Tax=Caerostris extrusa TaxID=172846 RepID=A0AAV4P6B1_CAEEX|nr:hypothetical protein CEXT_189081 [Caerostris extrusa]
MSRTHTILQFGRELRTVYEVVQNFKVVLENDNFVSKKICDISNDTLRWSVFWIPSKTHQSMISPISTNHQTQYGCTTLLQTLFRDNEISPVLPLRKRGHQSILQGHVQIKKTLVCFGKCFKDYFRCPGI